MSKNKKYFIFHKPFGVLSRFTPEHGKKALCDYLRLPDDVYPVGRLDEKSEGLLLLTNDKSVNKKLLDPANEHPRSYLVQVEGQITKDALRKLKSGVTISLPEGNYLSKPAGVKKTSISALPKTERSPSFNKNKGTSAIKLELTEGKNRQVRRMCAAVGFPVIRLVRTRIENLHLADLQPGELKKIPRNIFYDSLNIG